MIVGPSLTELSIADVLIGAGLIMLAAAALHDFAARTVPNTLAGLVAVTGLAIRVVDGQILFGIGVGLAVFVAAVLCWRRGWMGGGDVKLFAAAAMLVQPSAVGRLVLTIALAGGVLALAYLVMRVVVPAPPLCGQRPRSLLRRILRVERWRIHRNCPLPYASAIAAGAFICLLQG